MMKLYEHDLRLCCLLRMMTKHIVLYYCKQITGTSQKPVHERDSLDPGLLRLVAQRKRWSFCSVATVSTQAQRASSRSEEVRLFQSIANNGVK